MTRAVPLLLVLIIGLGAAVALLVDAGGATVDTERSTVRRYVEAWTRRDWPTMYGMLSPAVRASLSQATFSRRLRADAATATVTQLRFGRSIAIRQHTAQMTATILTSAFGTLHETATLVLDRGDDKLLAFSPVMLFPGLEPGESLSRTSRLGARGTIEAADGQPLAEGPNRSSRIPQVADAIVGKLGPIPAAERAMYRSLGYPRHGTIGQDGLELIFQRQLAGTPGGTLLAGHRRLASVAPVPGTTVRTTIDPKLEIAAINALGSGYGGLSVLNIKTGGIEAAAGEAFTDLQPPGSTFKIITAAAALQGGVAKLSTVYPRESQANLGGYVIQNAAGEVCGGTLLEAFATSCDTTFGPLGIQVGAKRLVSSAQRFGFDQPTHIPTALESMIPSAADIGDATAVGSTAIGQGKLEASTLQMANVAQAIADGGQRAIPSFVLGATPRYVTATTPQVAAAVQEMMEAVVSDPDGTGTSAQIPGYRVAGKTGTAELADTANLQNDVKDTDAWFVGYVPDSKAKIVACALFPANGYGADSAAPAVRSVLASDLGLSAP